jgi:catechol 2,3-dioxygenase-like lactoylglutathione lyase family enzyme
MTLPSLDVLSVKIPVSDLAVSRAWYAEVFGLREEMEWPDGDGVVRGVGFSGLGAVMLALREHPAAAAATDGFGFVNVRVPGEDDLEACAAHLDALGIRHTPVISAARGRLVGFHDPDGHELSFYAETHQNGVRPDAVRSVRAAGQAPSAAAPASAATAGGRHP